MSLINDMLNDLEKNKSKTSSDKKTGPSLPPADDDTSLAIKTTSEINIPSSEVLAQNKLNESQSYRQPWETDHSTAPLVNENASVSINPDSTVTTSNKHSHKRLIALVFILVLAGMTLAYFYFFPKEKKTEAIQITVSSPSATPSVAPSTAVSPTTMVEIHKDSVAPESAAPVNETPAVTPPPTEQSSSPAIVDNSTTKIAAESTSSVPLPATTEMAPATTTTSPTVSEPAAAPPTSSASLSSAVSPTEGILEVKPVEASPAVQAQNAYDQVIGNLANLSSSQAITQIQAIIDQYPTFNPARLAAAAMLIKFGNTDQALSVLKTGLALDPSNNQMAELAAHVLVEKNQINQALAILKTAQPATIEAAPDYYALMAGLYLKEKNYAQASIFYQSLTNLNPQNGTWWAGLAISLEKLGQTEAAMNAYNQAETVGGLSPSLEAFIDNTMQGS
jgi:MSHA biogenesis protein MshN